MNIHKNIDIKNRTSDKCIYCSRDATDKDHAVSKNLFPDKGRNLSLITVPACHGCNVGFSGDEEFFRLFIAGISLDWSEKANAVFNTQIKRQIERKPALGWQQFKKMALIDIRTPSGIYTGKKATAQKISPEDWSRCFRVIKKTVKGLIYTVHDIRISDDFELRTTLGWDNTIKTFLPFIEYFEPSVYSGVFSFGYAITTDAPPVSVWFTQYYDRITFCTWINKKGSFPEIKTSSKTQILNLLPKD